MQRRYNGKASFVAVYVCEAHASDEWPVGSKLSRAEQPTTLARRFELARNFVATTGLRIPVLVDSMANEVTSQWGAWPFRFFGISDGVLALKPQPTRENKFNFDIAELEEWLQQQC